MAMEFRLTSSTVGTLSVSLYLAGFALGPLILAPMSEIFGRLPVYHGGNIAFVAFVVGSALSQNVGQLLAFRLLSGLAGAVPLTIGGGTIADCIPIERRGGATALFGLGPVIGPVSAFYPRDSSKDHRHAETNCRHWVLSSVDSSARLKDGGGRSG
jgi:MFS family permease